MADRRWLALGILCVVRVSMGFQFQSIATVAPVLAGELGLGYAQVGTLVGLYMLPGVFLAIPGGLLGARFGDTRVVAVGLVLMAAGGFVSGLADDYPMQLAGRLLAGLGAVSLNVQLTKMVLDWFEGREVVLAMSVLINTFPVGIGLAQIGLGWLSAAAGWPAALHASAGLCLACLAVLLLLYVPHPNERRPAGRRGGGLARREWRLVCLAGAMWGLFNGAYASMLGFEPIFLASLGLPVANSGPLLAAQTVLFVLSVQAGGMLAQRFRCGDRLVVAGVLLFAGGLFGLAVLPAPATLVLLIGVVGGLPAGVLVSLPAEVLSPAARSLGMGLFFSWLYGGFTVLPPLAGLLQDASGSTSAALPFAGTLLLLVLPLLGGFRLLQRRARVTPA